MPVSPSTPPADVTITGTVPDYSQGADVFAINAESTIKQLPAVFSKINAVLAWFFTTAGQVFDNAEICNTAAGTATDAAVAAADSAEIAATASDYKGLWSGLTGALPLPARVGHAGTTWDLNNVLADVTASEPSFANGDWSAAPGFENPMTTLADIIVAGASGVPTRLGAPAGTEKHTLTFDADTGTFAWEVPETDRRVVLASDVGDATYGGSSFSGATDVDNIHTMNWGDFAIGDILEIAYVGQFSSSGGSNWPTLGIKIGGSSFTQLNASITSISSSIDRAELLTQIVRTGTTKVDISTKILTEGYNYYAGTDSITQTITSGVFTGSTDIIIRAASPSAARTFKRLLFTVTHIKA